MSIRESLSYWWMTIPADPSFGPDSATYNAVRLMALARHADDLTITSVTFAGNDPALDRAINAWAVATNRRYSRRVPNGVDSAGPKLNLRQRLYRVAPPLAALRILLAHIAISKRQTGMKSSPQGLTIVDYLAHLGPNAKSGGSFDSNYWGPLVSQITDAQEPVTWLHISAEQAGRSVVANDRERIDHFNAASPGHSLLHDAITWRVLGRAFRDYIRIVSIGLRNSGRRSFSDEISQIDLWPVFRTAWLDQFYGRTAMLNCLWVNLFEQRLADLPPQRLGVYLFENQPWEMAFIHGWRSAGHGKLIGFVHSTALFWNTRLFKDPRDEWPPEGSASMPWPDQVAVNGPPMLATCASAGYPIDRIIEVEALRYFDLARATSPRAPSMQLTVLVLGEYSTEASQYLLDLVSAALDLVQPPVRVTFRSHPALVGAPLALDPRIALDLQSSVGAALDAAAAVVCGSHSSVAVESVCRGRLTLMVRDPALLTTSPAEGMPGASFVSSPQELAQALNQFTLNDSGYYSPVQGIFTLDTALPRWHSIIDYSPSR